MILYQMNAPTNVKQKYIYMNSSFNSNNNNKKKQLSQL